MRKRIIYLITLAMFLVSAQNATAQDWAFAFRGGLASSHMDDLKYLQEHILSTYPVEGRITSSFPPYSSASITLSKKLYDNIRVGGGYNFSTTGGKSSYADYSGKIYTDMSVTSHRLGAYIGYLVLGGERFDLSLNGRLDANYSSLIIDSYYNIYTYGNGITNSYRSISPSGAVEGEFMVKFANFALGMDGGYLVDMKGKFKDTGDGDALLDPNDTERTLRSDWTGWYVHLKAMINLNF